MTLKLFPLAGAAFTLITGLANAQGVRETPLGRATASYAGEFSLLRGVRELANGSVLVVDPIDKVLLRLDPAMSRADTLGRKGSGPGEYAQPDGIWPLRADSSLLVDLGNNRLTVVDGGGKLGASTPIVLGGGNSEGPSIMLVTGVDNANGIWFRGSPGGDSLDVFRYDRGTRQATKKGRVSAPPMKRTEGSQGNGRSVSMTMIPLGAMDGWAVGSSGTLFIARAPAYRVETITSRGVRTVGAPVPFTPVRIDEAVKTEFVTSAARTGGISIRVEDSGNGPSFALSRQRAVDNQIRGMAFPATKPPFDAGGLLVDSRDRLWVRRHEPAGRPAVYDVFNTQGNRIGIVRLPADRTVIGFGARGVYVSRVDEDDLMYLERYAMPL